MAPEGAAPGHGYVAKPEPEGVHALTLSVPELLVQNPAMAPPPMKALPTERLERPHR
jgi:hypothetical protein